MSKMTIFKLNFDIIIKGLVNQCLNTNAMFANINNIFLSQ